MKLNFSPVKFYTKAAAVIVMPAVVCAKKYINLASLAVENASVYGVSAEELSEGLDISESNYINNLACNLKRSGWEIDTIKEFLNNFASSPAFADLLISSKDKKGHMRENIASSETITKIFDAHKINPDLTENLTEELDSNGNFRYNLSDIAKIVEVGTFYPNLTDIAKKDINAVYNLFSKTDKKGNRRFSADEIKSLYEWGKKLPIYTDILINWQMYKCEQKYRFSGEQISCILENYLKYPEFVKRILDEGESENKTYRFKGADIKKILEYNEINPELIQNLINDKRTFIDLENSWNIRCNTFRFNGEDISYILEKYAQSPELISSLLNEQITKIGAYEVYRNINDIKSFFKNPIN